nr:DUF4148 domain-containing protein [Paraburkholderia sp. BCC1885]
MKLLATLTLAASVLATPVLALAQTSDGPVTRAEVRADLVRLEQAGYSPSGGANANYPADVLAAEAKVAANDDTRLTNDAVGGTSLGGVSVAGGGRTVVPSTCVGPVSFCNIYAGG